MNHIDPVDQYLDMPDDQISNMSAPAVVEPPAVTEPTQEERDAAAAAEQAEADRLAAEQAAAAGNEGGQTPEEEEAARVAAEQAAAEAALNAPDDKQAAPPVPAKKPDDKETPPAQTEEERLAAETAAKEATDAETARKAAEATAAPALTVEEKAAALDSLMTFKANGKEIKLKSPSEILQLVQMGANYTKKMQQLQPAMRLIKMLDNNKLMDATQLSYLIDLHQKKPEAIQKLLADSKFDPMAVDAEKAAQYKPGAHQVTDAEVQFEQVLEEVESTETGQELITEVTRQWDDGSRRALFQDPKLLQTLNIQKANGLYGLISAEMEHRKLLGELQGVPFLIAYQQVGQDLHAKGLLKPPTPAAAATPVVTEPLERQPAATRVVTPPAKVINTPAAKAASAPKGTAAPVVQAEQNYLDMPDSQFLQDFQGRL